MLKSRKNLLSYKFLILLFVGITTFLLNSCSTSIEADTYSDIDYSLDTNWISRGVSQLSNSVDVFYVYPTVNFSETPENMDINNIELREKAVGVFAEQASIFAETTKIYAPFYRQVSIAVLDLPSEQSEDYFSIGYNDVKKSFFYYLEHFNQGKPFILAGHSQGSDIILELMKELFDDHALQEKLIASYIIGYSVTDEDLESCKWLKIAQKADDLGVIITYNTQSVDATGSPVLMPGANCVNPLSWNTDTTRVNKSFNKGAVFFDENHEIEKEIQNYTDAKIGDNGALIASTPSPDDYYSPTNFFPRGVYHAYDYNFFYRNLEENVKIRIKSYLNKK